MKTLSFIVTIKVDYTLRSASALEMESILEKALCDAITPYKLLHDTDSDVDKLDWEIENATGWKELE